MSQPSLGNLGALALDKRAPLFYCHPKGKGLDRARLGQAATPPAPSTPSLSLHPQAFPFKMKHLLIAFGVGTLAYYGLYKFAVKRGDSGFVPLSDGLGLDDAALGGGTAVIACLAVKMFR